MTKEYKYFVWVSLNGQYNLSKRLTIKINHPIDDSDFEAIEKQHSTSGFFGLTATVSNYKLMKVTGDFTYTVIYQKMEFGKWVTYSQIITQNHKLTSATIKSDYREFIKFLYPCDSAIAPKEWSYEYTRILLFQEIPDD